MADRVALVRALREVADGDPADALRLARLLPAARALLAAASGSGPGSGSGSGFDPARDGFDLEALERRVLRAAHLARLREALAAGDDEEIAAAAWPDLYGAIELLSAGERERVEALTG
ncbi:MAG: hypothetical protein H0U10_09105 [Chloroflexia bacterium]|nr:hypothetical protein [Chloroflexia bacterium]